MLGVLVLLEAKARGHLLRYNVAEGFWVFIGLLRDLCCGRVFVGVFFFHVLLSFLPFSVFASFCILPVCSEVLIFFIKFLCLSKKKKF